MSEKRSELHAELDVELAELASSADPEGDDEPDLELYATRLHSLHDAVVVVEDGTVVEANVVIEEDVVIEEVTTRGSHARDAGTAGDS